MLAITLVACTGTTDESGSTTETGDAGQATDLSTVDLDSHTFDVGPFEDGEPIVVVGTDSDIAYFIAAVGHDRGYVPSDESYSLDTMTGEWTEISPPPIEHALVRGVGVSTYDTLVVIGEDCEPGAGELYLCHDGRPKEVVGFAYDRADDKWTRFDVPSDDVRGYRGLPTPATGVPGDAEVMYWRFGDFGGRLSMIFELDIRTLEWRQRDDIYVGIGMCAVGDTLYGLEPGLLPRLVTARPGAEVAIEEVPGLTADASESPPLRPFCTSTHLTIGQASDHEESGAPQLTRPLNGDTWSEVPDPPGRSRGVWRVIESSDRLFAFLDPLVTYSEPGSPTYSRIPLLAFNPATTTWSELPELPQDSWPDEAVTTAADTIVIRDQFTTMSGSGVIIRTAP